MIVAGVQGIVYTADDGLRLEGTLAEVDWALRETRGVSLLDGLSQEDRAVLDTVQQPSAESRNAKKPKKK